MYEKETLATEIFRELKASCRRWFIAFLIMTGLELATIVGFVWYISLPVEETTTTQTVDGLNEGNILQTIGEDVTYGAGNTNGEAQTESSQETEKEIN